MGVRKKGRAECGGARVACDGLEGEDAERVEGLIEVLGARAWDGRGVPDLVIVGPAPSGIEGVMRVEVGAGSGLRLPGDEELLVQVILASCAKADGAVPPGVIGVAHWDGGRCSAEVAQLLAETMRGVLVDMSGSGPLPALLRDPDAPGIRWADLSATENAFPADLPDHLVDAGGYRILTADARGGARLGDPRQRPVLEAVVRSGRIVIVDCGLWGEGADARLGAVEGLVLVGPADFEGAARAAFALALSPPSAPHVLVARGRGRSRLRSITRAPVLGWKRASRGGGRAILRALMRPGGESAGRGRRSG